MHISCIISSSPLPNSHHMIINSACFPERLHAQSLQDTPEIINLSGRNLHQVSGNNFTTSMLTLRMPEENVLNGGAFGFEGSLICTVLMIVLTILIVWWGEKREAISLAVPQSC